MRARHLGQSQPRRRQSVPVKLATVKAGDCEQGKYGVTVHSRLAGKEIELNCNTNFG